ncbi:hypothetical protein C8F01DRAFT_1372749 [Mycena amicta]|nr:hypothetical protein C8F01DRAFT_1372749 [Mycena amicta]
MAENHLPDEIIAEILSPALKVPDDAFTDNSLTSPSPFATYSESTSAYLVVCKSWLRVATPLLYHVVVLRSKAQAKALSKALSANPDLGRFIKKLRVEGGYGTPMHAILKLAPDICDLFLSLDIFASDSTEGLSKGLSLISPRRLILHNESHRRENKQFTALLNALLKAIPKWDRLVALDLPELSSTAMDTILYPCIDNQQLLQMVSVRSPFAVRNISKIFSKCPIREMRVKGLTDQRYIDILNPDEKLKSLLKYTLRGTEQTENKTRLPEVLASLDPYFKPMSNAPKDTQDLVWSRILYFAMSIPEHTDNNPPKRKMPKNLPILLVSKDFHTLGLPHFYAHVVLRQFHHPADFARVLASYPSLGPRIRTIRGDSDMWEDGLVAVDGSESDFGAFVESDRFPDSQSETEPFVYQQPSPHDPTASPMRTILSQTTHLVHIDLLVFTNSGYEYGVEIPLSWNAFVALAKCAGTRLEELAAHILTDRDYTSPRVFGCFTTLKTLRWKCTMEFTLKDLQAYRSALPQLEDLEVQVADKSLFTVLSSMRLPSLRRLTLWPDVGAKCDGFLTKHGRVLTELDIPVQCVESDLLEFCSNLVALTITWGWRVSPRDSDWTAQPPDKSVFMPTKLARALTKITFAVSMPFKSDKKHVPEWSQYLIDLLPLDSIPNLSEIHFPGIQWPTTERDIAKNDWVRAAECLLQSNVSMVDGAGKKWRSRLKVRGR